MTFTLPALPYAKDALAPHVGAETLDFHHGKHHAGYIAKLNTLLEGHPLAGATLEEVIAKSDGALLDNAAQAYNHAFYWRCMKPKGGGHPEGDLAAAITRDFGSFDRFREAFAKAAVTQFGSGWAWLVRDGDKLAVTQTSNADLPLRHAQTPLLTIDVWEHAYYIDYRNARAKYVDAFIDHLVDWGSVHERFRQK